MMKRLSWQSAYAIGADQSGNFIWGGSRNWRNRSFATDTAIQFCAGKEESSCKTVILNGEFVESDFLAAARQFGAQNIASTRKAFLRSLVQEPSEAKVVGPAGGGGGGPAFGFTSARQ
jgi:hypothetical protein